MMSDEILENLKSKYIEVVKECIGIEEAWGKYTSNPEHDTCIVEIQLLEEILYESYGYKLDYFDGNIYMGEDKITGEDVLNALEKR